jgi:hypothetical protein
MRRLGGGWPQDAFCAGVDVFLVSCVVEMGGASPAVCVRVCAPKLCCVAQRLPLRSCLQSGAAGPQALQQHSRRRPAKLWLAVQQWAVQCSTWCSATQAISQSCVGQQESVCHKQTAAAALLSSRPQRQAWVGGRGLCNSCQTGPTNLATHTHCASQSEV